MPRSAFCPASPVGISAVVDVPVDGTADVHMPGIADCVMRKEYRITEYPDIRKLHGARQPDRAAIGPHDGAFQRDGNPPEITAIGH